MTTVHNGHARQFVLGHNSTLRKITKDDYSVEDRGYETPCWIWQGAMKGNGYGQVTIAGRKSWTHRAMYEQEVGPIPEGLSLDHMCEVPACIRPSHLEPKTHAEHMRRHFRILDENQRHEVRSLYANGQWTHRRLAARFGIGRSTVGTILSENQAEPTRLG